MPLFSMTIREKSEKEKHLKRKLFKKSRISEKISYWKMKKRKFSFEKMSDF